MEIVFKSPKRLHQLFVSAICLLLLVQYHAYYNLSSLPIFSKNLVVSAAKSKLPVAIEEDASFTTFFRPDDHVIRIPSITTDCSRLLVVMTELNAGWGIGNMLNMYRHALMIAAYTNRTLVLYEPESDTSPFGCPVSNDNTSSYPSGLQRLVHHPEWLSGSCSVPCSLPYDVWMQRANVFNSEAPFLCADKGNEVSVLTMGGMPLKRFFITKVYGDMHARKQKEWIARLGADADEIAWLSANKWEEGVRWDSLLPGMTLESVLDHTANKTSWDEIFGILTRAGALAFQPWIARSVRRRVSDIPIPREYVAIHVRRGDKLTRAENISTSADLVEAFWQKRGYNSSTQPTNYIPFSHYLSKLDASSPRDVYVATDDQETVRREISALEPNRFNFHFYPDSASTIGHLQDVSDCMRKYERTIGAMADLLLLIRSTIAVAEYSSNWGILVRFHRTFLADGRVGSASVRDMRIAFGVDAPVCEFFANCLAPAG